jgi:hypothetical protein
MVLYLLLYLDLAKKTGQPGFGAFFAHFQGNVQNTDEILI